jgi:hypothetical protein
VTRSDTFVQIPLYLPLEVAVDDRLAPDPGFAHASRLRMGAEAVRTFTLELEQDFLRQRILQSKRDKVFRTLAFDMGKVTAARHSTPLRIGCRVPNTGRTQFVANALKPSISNVQPHGNWISLGAHILAIIKISECVLSVCSAGFQTCRIADFQVGRPPADTSGRKLHTAV